MALKVYDIGTEVKLHSKRTGKILAVNIAGVEKHITYQVAWWNDGSRNTAWLGENEFEVFSDEDKKFQIGFKK